MMELTIDTASPLASIALTDTGILVAEQSWAAGRGHASELIPAIERLFAGAGVDRSAIGAVFINRGPGAYGGLRVGISTGLALAYALGADVLGYGRLEADAFHLLGTGQSVCAVHDAGRGEYAWAVYERDDGSVRERVSPRIDAVGALVASLPANTLVAGEVTAALRAQLPPDTRVVEGAAALRRAGSGAAVAWPRYVAGARDSTLALTPLYLREPKITPSRQALAASERGQTGLRSD